LFKKEVKVDNSHYEVLNPWAEADSISLKGISPRLTSIDGKKIGIFRNFKQAAKPYADVMEAILKERYPNSEIFRYDSEGANVLETETENKARFEQWAKNVDAGIFLFGN
jgi:hypothetical protein